MVIAIPSLKRATVPAWRRVPEWAISKLSSRDYVVIGREDAEGCYDFLVEEPSGPTWTHDIQAASLYDGPNAAMEAALTFGGRQVLAASLAAG